MRKFLILGLISFFFAATTIACNKSEETSAPAPEASVAAPEGGTSPAAPTEASPAAGDMSSPAAAASPAGS